MKLDGSGGKYVLSAFIKEKNFQNFIQFGPTLTNVEFI